MIEMHNKSIIVPIALFISIGGWFLWNILLDLTYNTNSKSGKPYFVRNGFFEHFGKNPLWWLTLILIIVAVVVLDLAIVTLRAAWWPRDEDVFQELERDLGVRMRFEEAAAMELQGGWQGKEAMKQREEEKRIRKDEEQSRREREVGELLRNRPTGMKGMQRLASQEEGRADLVGEVRGGRDSRRISWREAERSNEEAVGKSNDILETLRSLKGKAGKKST